MCLNAGFESLGAQPVVQNGTRNKKKQLCKDYRICTAAEILMKENIQPFLLTSNIKLIPSSIPNGTDGPGV